MSFLMFLLPVFLLLTLGALGFGLYGMMRGGKYTGDRANKMMQWRIIFQAIAIFIIMMMLYLLGK